MPWPALAVRALLAGDARVTDLTPRIGTRPPADVSALHIVVQSPTLAGVGERPRHGLGRPLVLAEARAAAASVAGGDVEDEVMAAAAVLAAVLAEARNVVFENASWSTLDSTSAFALPPDEREGASPVFRGAVQAELALHARRT